MTKISWNDINDADSSLSSDFDQMEETSTKPHQKHTQVSAQNNKLKNACDKLSLQKLEQHGKGDVLLYVPNSFQQQADQVSLILEQCQLIYKVNRIKNIGWNALAKYQDAKRLVIEGFEKDSIVIKFIYSNKNEAKNEKKLTYVEKGNKQTYLEKSSSVVEGHSKTTLKKEQSTLTAKGKVKWVAKDKNSEYTEEKKSNFHERVHSPRDYNKMKDIKSPKKYVQKDPIMSHTQSVKQTEKQQILLKEEERPELNKNLTYQEKKQQRIEERKPVLEQSDSSEDFEAQKKKKKQKKKKVKNGKPDKKDSNNPFSFFAN